MSDTNFTNEAPDVEEAIPTTTNGSSTRGGGGVSFTNTGESGEPHPESSTERSKYGNKRLSAASKNYDMDGDGELDEAEQAMRDMDKSGRGFLKNEEVYGMMKDQLQMQKDLFKMKKVIAGLMVFVVILALSNLGTSFASAILAKDSTTNDQNELVSKETGEALATQSTAKVIVIDEEFDQEMTRQRKLACSTTKSQGNIESAACNYEDLSNISTEDGEMMVRLCSQGVTVHTVKTDANGDLVETPLCPIAGTTDTVNWGPVASQVRYKGTYYPSQMTISHANNRQTALMPQTSIGGTDHYSLESALVCLEGTIEQNGDCVAIGGQTGVVLLCDEPVCGADGTLYNCADEVPDNNTAAPPVQCTCGGGVSGRNPADGCFEAGCPECLPVECLTGHFPADACCSQCTDLNNGFVDFPGVVPASDDDCADGYLFDASADPNACILCDASSGFAVVNGACACPEGTTEQDGTCVASSSGGGCQLEYLKCGDSSFICTTQVKYCTDGAGGSYSVSPDGCNGCVYPACCDGNAPVDQADNPV